MLRLVPGHSGEQMRHSAEARNTRKEKPAADNKWKNGEPEVHGEGKNCAHGRQRPGNDLDLAHERKNSSRTTVYRESGVDPALRAAFNQNAIFAPCALELLNGFAGPSTRVAEDVNRPPRHVLGEKVLDFQLIERSKYCARDVRASIFRRSADIQQLRSIARSKKR